MLQRLACAQCHATLTGTIDVQPGVYPPGREWSGYEPKPLTGAGYAIVSPNPILWSDDPQMKPPLQFAPQHWLNPVDVSGQIENADNAGSLNGCCGPSGHGGPNQRCKSCGCIVGTLMADCWTDHVFILQPDETYWIEE